MADLGSPSRMSADIPYIFREAGTGDADDISKLIGSTWAKFFGYSVSESDLETYLTKTVSVSQIRLEIEDPNKRFLVAVATGATHTSPARPVNEDARRGREHGAIVGVVQLNLNTEESSVTTPNPVELNRLYINPDLQGSGLAPLLLDYAEKESRELGKDGIWLGVWEDNTRGIRFYEKMGFVRRGEHSFWVGESERRDWIMEKALK